MKNFFKFDVLRFALSQLPVRLRFPVLSAYADAVAQPAADIYASFAASRDATLYRLSITPQTCYLEKALNDRFDNQQRRIYITDGARRNNLYIYTREENFPVYINERGNDAPKYIYQRSESIETTGYNFIVNVTKEISFNTDEMRALLDRHKLAGKIYNINIY